MPQTGLKMDASVKSGSCSNLGIKILSTKRGITITFTIFNLLMSGLRKIVHNPKHFIKNNINSFFLFQLNIEVHVIEVYLFVN